ncbi:hypothetical protein I3259_17960 [Photobacterium sp. Ph5]|nr:hypothetical protein [Photobacterium sp. Ph6]MCG3877454.1 hypothetical protein [Photobacterium sp. Ph5]
MSSYFNADLELQHIYIEVQAERYHHLKAFIEAYYCFTHGALTKQDKPDWEAIFDVGIRTTKAEEIMDRKLLVRDMLVPLSVLIGYMKVMVRDDVLTIEGLRNLLNEQLKYVVMTREEYADLSKQGLRDAMPISFYQRENKHYKQVSARYDVAGITLVE